MGSSFVPASSFNFQDIFDRAGAGQNSSSSICFSILDELSTLSDSARIFLNAVIRK